MTTREEAAKRSMKNAAMMSRRDQDRQKVDSRDVELHKCNKNKKEASLTREALPRESIPKKMTIAIRRNKGEKHLKTGKQLKCRSQETVPLVSGSRIRDRRRKKTMKASLTTSSSPQRSKRETLPKRIQQGLHKIKRLKPMQHALKITFT